MWRCWYRFRLYITNAPLFLLHDSIIIDWCGTPFEFLLFDATNSNNCKFFIWTFVISIITWNDIIGAIGVFFHITTWILHFEGELTHWCLSTATRCSIVFSWFSWKVHKNEFLTKLFIKSIRLTSSFIKTFIRTLDPWFFLILTIRNVSSTEIIGFWIRCVSFTWIGFTSTARADFSIIFAGSVKIRIHLCKHTLMFLDVNFVSGWKDQINDVIFFVML